MRPARLLAPWLLALAACGAAPPPASTPSRAATPGAATKAIVAPRPRGVGDTGTTPDAEGWRLPGAFSPGDDLARLRLRYGAGNVRVAELAGAEGERVRGAILFADDPRRRAYLHFRDPGALRGLRFVEVSDAGSRWRLDNDVAVGMPLSRLVVRNGRPIRFTGFDWDYGGAIGDWNGGRLQQPAGDPARRVVRLVHGDAGDGAYPVGDDTFSSDDPRYPRLGSLAHVGMVGVAFASGEDR